MMNSQKQTMWTPLLLLMLVGLALGCAPETGESQALSRTQAAQGTEPEPLPTTNSEPSPTLEPAEPVATSESYPGPLVNPETSPEIAENLPYPDRYAVGEIYPDPDSEVAPEDGVADERPAANADVTMVRAVEAADGTWTFHVTVEHPDTGWDDYADGWDVVTPTGEVLKTSPDEPFTRLLLHPHETEQPFTRSQAGLTIPEGVEQLIVRAHDLVDGWGGEIVIVDLTQEGGKGFIVERAGE